MEHYIKIGIAGSPTGGFTNQIFALITGIINAHKQHKKVVYVDDFLNDISKNIYTPITEIFNITDINNFLVKNYDITIRGKKNIDKKLTFLRKIPSYTYSFGWINSYNNNMFEKILTNITYSDEFIQKSEIIKKNIDMTKKINVIHLRLEDDAIIHWSKQNNMSQSDFKTYIEEKYIYLIKTYLSKTDENIILTHSSTNGVIDFLTKHNYDYKFISKFFSDREKNAIIDLLVSKSCNNIFIGNFNFKNSNGSTFSYYIGKCLDNNVSKIYIDLDKIHDKEIICVA